MEFKNNLLKRREIVFDMQSSSNPGFEGAIKAAAERFKASEEQIVVKKVSGSFGSDKFRIDAFIYDSARDKERIEPKKKEKKAEGVK